MPVVLFEIDLKDRSSWDLQKKAEFDFPGYYKIVADLKKLRDSSYDSINVELSGELKIRNSNGVVLWNNTFQIPLIKNQVGAEIAYFNLKDFGKTGNEYYFELSVEGKDLSFLYSHLTVYIRKRYIHSFLD